MNIRKKNAQIKTEVVTDIKKLNKAPKFNREKINENIGNSITKSMMHVRMAVEMYSSRVLFIPLFFKSFFKSEKISRCGSMYLSK
jgi:hypothetical protein